MAKDPAILFNTQDFLIGSSTLTPLQKGHYITLLCYQQQSITGSLTLNEIKTLMKGDFVKQWPVIMKKFKEDDHGFFNERMRKEMIQREKLSNRQRDTANKRWSMPRHQNGTATAMPARVSSTLVNNSNKERETNGTATAMPRHKDNNLFFDDVETELLKNQIELERICMAAKKPPDLAKMSLHKFHLHLQEKEQYPKSRKALFAGFEKWLMNEKKPEASTESPLADQSQNHRLKRI